MATQFKPVKVKLPADIKKQLEGMTENIEESKKQMAALKEIGLDMKPLEDKLEWAETARKVLLENFT